MSQFFATSSYLKYAIGLGANQAGTGRANAIIAEERNDPANLVKLAEDDGVKTLFHNVRNPAGNEP